MSINSFPTTLIHEFGWHVVNQVPTAFTDSEDADFLARAQRQAGSMLRAVAGGFICRQYLVPIGTTYTVATDVTLLSGREISQEEWPPIKAGLDVVLGNTWPLAVSWCSCFLLSKRAANQIALYRWMNAGELPPLRWREETAAQSEILIEGRQEGLFVSLNTPPRHLGFPVCLRRMAQRVATDALKRHAPYRLPDSVEA